MELLSKFSFVIIGLLLLAGLVFVFKNQSAELSLPIISKIPPPSSFVSPTVMPNQEITFLEIANNSQGIGDKSQQVVKDSQEWENLLVDLNLKDNLDQFRVDFSQEMVLAVFQGAQRTGGYSISVNKIIDRGDYVEVLVTEVSPGKTCLVTQALTSPYQLVKTAKLNEPINFTVTQQVNECE